MSTLAHDERPLLATGGAQNEFAGSAPIVRDGFPESVVDELSQFAVRMLEDALAAGLPWVWLRRAQQFEDARPKPGDFTGRASAADLAERDQRLAQSAETCRMAAEFTRRYPTPLHAYERALVAQMVGGAA